MAEEKHGPPQDQLLSAAVILLERIAKQTDEIEPALKRIFKQGEQTNQLLQKILEQVTQPP